MKNLIFYAVALLAYAFAFASPAEADGTGEWALWMQDGPDGGFCEIEIECTKTIMGPNCCRILDYN